MSGPQLFTPFKVGELTLANRKKWSGYHRRSLVETKMHCFKLLGQRVAARTFDPQSLTEKEVG